MASATTGSTRERIIDAAEGCFARSGIAKTTVEDIATAAGMSRATLYRSVAGGRDELVSAVMLRDLGRFLDRLSVRLRREPSVPDAVVEGVMDAVSFVRAQPHIGRFLASEAAGHVAPGAVERTLALCGERLRPYFEAARRDGGIRPDIEVDGAVEFLFRIVASLIVVDRARDEAATRNFLRSYVVPVIVGP
ncbi:TetR/AcrR family transcriptional regulator [Thermomonospora umbrina]|uniref:TetR family transcriptional regulator n=1 Tax=Thermomonospora umbrina TaxID=111806 RepID=A0A3D9T459_9ACTN|nr:TetR/AcrR family transcriptional regulator [Thermomonospora umbrina]REE98601.1 TetR family transcriptional regulator [Thermomonospora umbrina]